MNAGMSQHPPFTIFSHSFPGFFHNLPSDLIKMSPATAAAISSERSIAWRANLRTFPGPGGRDAGILGSNGAVDGCEIHQLIGGKI